MGVKKNKTLTNRETEKKGVYHENRIYRFRYGRRCFICFGHLLLTL